MDEKERYDANREARHDAAAHGARQSERRVDTIARFVGALLYGDDRTERRDRDRKPRPEEDRAARRRNR